MFWLDGVRKQSSKGCVATWKPGPQAGKCVCCDYSQAEACVPGALASGKPGGVRAAESGERAGLACGMQETGDGGLRPPLNP